MEEYNSDDEKKVKQQVKEKKDVKGNIDILFYFTR